MTKERTLQWWKDAIKNGIRFQEKYGGSNNWATYKNYYRHNFADGVLPVNLVFSVLRTMVPQVYFRNPIVTVTPTRPGLEYELHARLTEDIDKWLIRETGVKYQMKYMITDGFLCGIAGGFIGYDSQYGYSPEKTIGGEGGASLTQFDSKGDRIEYNNAVTPGMPWFLRARPEDTIYPWGTERKSSAEWVALRVFRPVEDVKKDKKYTGTKDLHGTFNKQRTTAEGTQIENDIDGQHDHEWIELWQIHDKKTGKILALSMDHATFLRNEEDALQVDGLPVEDLVFNKDPDYIYGVPDAKIIEPQQLEMNEIRTQSMKHRRVDIIKLLVKKGVLSPDQIENLLNEDVAAAVEVDMDGQIRDAAMPFNSGASAILADMANAGEVIRQDVREMVGFSRAATGEYQGKTHIAAAETNVVQQANQIRLDERRDMVADLLTNIVRKYNQLIFTNWTQPIVRSVVGPDGAKWWLKFTGPQIKSEYDYRIDPANGVPTTPETKRKDATEMIKAYAEMNSGKIKQGMPIPPELQRYFFSQYDGINIDKLLAQEAQQPAGGMPAPGGAPGQAVPPQVAASLMQRGGK